MCTVLLPPGNNSIAVNKYIISYHIISYHIILIIINIKDLTSLIRSVSRVSTLLANVSSVFQLFSFLVHIISYHIISYKKSYIISYNIISYIDHIKHNEAASLKKIKHSVCVLDHSHLATYPRFGNLLRFPITIVLSCQ